ncbi:ATP-binding protein [Flammeovirgaceae bacterium SG7u.111]|nr:ATP-binding protein [Flammeovirgaceae bacterium SG7u.132]WPO35408.1 ATP-binding protein [Flammeovirgaceae bacterium SG7u.111]
MEASCSLQSLSIFDGIPQNQLEWVLENGKCLNFSEGDYLFQKGDPIDQLYIILEGKFIINIEQNGEFRNTGEINAGELSGSLPYSRASSAFGFAIATKPSKVVSLHKSYFLEMIREHHELTTMLVHTMTSRVRDFTNLQQQQEKMMALGKLSAGLAHELNNPASAMVRSAQDLKQHLAAESEKFKDVISIDITPEKVDAVNDVLFSKIKTRERQKLSLSQKTELEDEIADWLEDHGFEDGYELADVFVDFAFTVHDFEEVGKHVTAGDMVPVVSWMGNVLTTESLVTEIEASAERISNLVSSIKSYSHMDKGTDFEQVDIRSGIENTLKMLNHKLKQKQIAVETDFGKEAPLIHGKVGALNQVWTNIIDNATDALDQGGKLSISIQKELECLTVNIEDNGHGIPEETQSKIFDPFFTTKKIGQGTGLGLDIVAKILREHKADIRVQSKPGQTKFIITFKLIQG